ncbi:MAG: DUF262 domain-containing protein [Bacteroidales bacterium]|nr:DUF262 domain-containing protein [Bacteroidales bacterium]
MAEIKADKIEINSLFDDFWFLIPEYQRSYIWDTDNINDLLDDLWYAFQNKYDDEYFLGSLVLKRTSEENFEEFEVLDGQQRLTTFFILLAVLRDHAHDEDLKEACHGRIYQKANKYKKIPERIRLIYKIRDNVEDFIKTYLLEENGTQETEKITELSSDKNISISHMATAILTIEEFFAEKESDELEKFGVFIAEKPIFIYVSTVSMEDAFRMFTILNNRGVPLTSGDILKSKNIGIIDDTNQEKYAKKWEDIENDLGDDFDRFLSFFRTILVKEKARLSLLDEFEENIYSKGLLNKGKDTVDLIEKYKDHYDRLITFQEDLELSNDYKNLITIMQIGFPSTDWVPALLYYFETYGNNNLSAFLKKLEYKVSGDWICQLTPTQRIDNINKILKAIENTSDYNQLLQKNHLFKVNEDELKRRLNGFVYGRKFAKYVLLKFEYLLGDNTVHLSNYNVISVEHVLPRNPNGSSKWVQLFTDKSRFKWTNKLANLVLISKRKNSALGNLDFADKKAKYLKGRIDIFPSNKIFQTYTDWTPDVLGQRQKYMVDKLIAN